MSNSLQLSTSLTSIVNQSRNSWEFLEQVTPITQELLRFWFDEAYCESRMVNFHEGQRQAILNTIYAHEILKTQNVADLYDKVGEGMRLSEDAGLDYLETKRYAFPRYCMKMATGTGKTWVLEALLIRQYLNAKNWGENFSKNFMIVAPWLIVYDRLQDAFLGKISQDGQRNFATSDLKIFEDLFIPEHLRDEIFSFVQSSVVTKEQIGKKFIWTGQIILTNWHIFLERNKEQEFEDNIDPLANPEKIIKDIFPLRPWISAGNSLEILDNQVLWGRQLEYMKNIPDLIVFNDEAHHLWESTSKSDIEEDKKRQQALNEISLGKKLYIQIDFSATPYIQKWKDKQYFPHIIVDFPLIDAIKKWYVKTLVLDKRKEIATLELDFKAQRDENNKVIWLSDGQKVMIQAGLEKLKVLEKDFDKISIEHNKFPKIMIVCEDTMVVPFVTSYLIDLGYNEDEYLEVHSNKKWEISDEERKILKNKLFSIDKHQNPKIIISVLMLREGFDVNNICIIVPLRASTSGILLEQTIGRGLRLMRRWTDFEDIKAENRRNLLVKKLPPVNYFDILSIVEHPAFSSFYDELIADGWAGIDEWEISWWGEKILWDMITVWLKENFEEYDIARPIILSDVEEILSDPVYSLERLNAYHHSFESLKNMVPQNEKFISDTLISWTKFGDYDVIIWIFSAKNYNDFLGKLIHRVTQHTAIENMWVSKRNNKIFPTSQVNIPKLAWVIDLYLKYKLFKQEINYLESNNRKVLMIQDVVEFVIKEVTRMVVEAQDTQSTWKSEVLFRKLSEVEKLNMRKNYSLNVVKCIYPQLQYPSNKWELEKNFIEFCDNDWLVQSFCKINENKHTFLRFRYIRSDGIPAYYYPDFIVKTDDKIFLVETKWTSSLQDENVKRKKISARNYIERINKLESELRENRLWEYALLGEDRFYTYQKNWGNIKEMLESTKLQENKKTLF